MTRRIAILSGGDSMEAKVSRNSGKAIETALSKTYQEVKQIELDKNVVPNLLAFNPDVIFPALHGPPGEDGTVQGLLDILGFSYVGSGVKSSAVAMDKILAKQVFKEAGLPIANHVIADQEIDTSELLRKITSNLGTSICIKPPNQGSALGVTLISKEEDIELALNHAFKFGSKVLVEERVFGREITVGLLDTEEGVKAFPIIEVTTPEDTWYDYDHRYTAGLSKHIIPAKISSKLSVDIKNCAIEAHKALGCRDLSRADFILRGDEFFLLEINTLPGMTSTSLYPEGAEGFGLQFPQLLDHLINRAFGRRVKEPINENLSSD
ncbi:D-alanine--D-alanine ligase [Gammaproteobacteria bacterium]|nr:D-alanine--D-alanine ligase [Gammaproteobacteria bacterium]